MKNTIDSPRFSLRRTAGVVFLMQIGGAGLLFLVSFLLARLLGAEGLGTYDYADAWLEILLMFALLGFDRLLIRKIAAHQTLGEWGLIRGIWRYARSATLLIALCFAGIGALFSAATFARNDAALLLALWIALALLPIRVYIKLWQVAMQGFGKTAFGQFPEMVARPLLLVIFLAWHGLFIDLPLSAPLATLLHFAAAGGAFVLSLLFFKRILPGEVGKHRPVYETGSWMASALPLMIISGMTLLNSRVGTVILGATGDFAAVSLYGVSVRVAGLIALVLTSTSAVVAPMIAQLYTQGEKTRLQQIVSRSTLGIIAVSLPVGVGIILFGVPLLHLFGPDFAPAYPALVIVCIGQLINTATGPVGWLLMMTGYEWEMSHSMTFAVVTTTLANLLLVPSYGLIGAAAATVIGSVLRNLLLTWYVWRRLEIVTTFALPGWLKKKHDEQA